MEDPTNWMALATIGTAVIAFFGVIISLYAHRRIERTKWLDDRRLEAYSRLAFTVSEVAAETTTWAELGANKNSDPGHLESATAAWKDAYEAFNEAQQGAAILAGKSVAPLIEELSKSISALLTTARQTVRQVDPTTMVISPGDPESRERMLREADQIPHLRNRLLRKAKEEIGTLK